MRTIVLPTVRRRDSETRQIDGRAFHVRTWNTNGEVAVPTFVLIHGLGVSSRYTIPLADQLGTSARVFAPDLPGFGKSPGPRRALSVPELAAALDRWVQSRLRAPFVLIGHSFGCQVAAEYAVHHLNQIQCLVLAGPTVDPLARRLSRQFLRLLVDETREPVSIGIPMLLDYFDAGLPRILATGHEMIADHLETKLPLITKPTLVVRGGRDPIVPQRWSEDVTRLLPDGHLTVVPGAPHALNYACPAEPAPVLMAFAGCLRNRVPHAAGTD